jgi:hypothetical protein
MSEKKNTDNVRFSQVLAGALAAITAAVLGSTMGVAGTVIGAGLASAVTTVGGALYMRSIQRTKDSVRTVRDMVVARAGGTSVTLVEERLEKDPAKEADKDTDKAADEAAEGDAARLAEGTGLETRTEIVEGEPAPPDRGKLRWPALIAASVLAFLVGMMVITGVEAIRGEPLSGGNGTTIGDIVRQGASSDDGDDDAPPATTRTTPDPTTSTVTVTDAPPTSDEEEPATPSSGVSEPESTTPDTTTDNAPTGSVPVPQTGQSG